MRCARELEAATKFVWVIAMVGNATYGTFTWGVTYQKLSSIVRPKVLCALFIGPDL